MPTPLIERIAAAAALSAVCCWAGAAAGEVTVSDAWVRGTVEGQDATGAYMTLRSPTDARLVAVSSPQARRCSVHEMTMSGNVMRMRTLASLPIPAGRPVRLQEGGDHVMLEGLQHSLQEGGHVDLALTFVQTGSGKRSTVQVHAPVRPLGR